MNCKKALDSRNARYPKPFSARTKTPQPIQQAAVQVAIYDGFTIIL